MTQQSDRALLLVTEAISDALETPIEELPPLSESISIDGLDAVLSHSDAGDVTVAFPYADLRVFVHSAGLVYVRPRYEDGKPELEEGFVHGT